MTTRFWRVLMLTQGQVIPPTLMLEYQFQTLQELLRTNRQETMLMFLERVIKLTLRLKISKLDMKKAHSR